MTDISELIDAAARAAVEHSAIEVAADLDGPLSLTRLVSRLHAAGETELAAKAALAAKRAGKSVDVPAALEPALRKAQAEGGAETFRAVNKQNGTAYPLPAWIRAELGE